MATNSAQGSGTVGRAGVETGRRAGMAALTLGVGRTVQFHSWDLRGGDAPAGASEA